MSYTYVVEWDIKLVPETPKSILRLLRSWHHHPHRFESLLDVGVDVGAAFGVADIVLAHVKLEKNLIIGSGIVPRIKTIANFKRRDIGIERLRGVVEFLAPWIANDGVIGIVRGEDDLFYIDDRRSMFETLEPALPFTELRLINRRLDIKGCQGDLYKLHPWVSYAF